MSVDVSEITTIDREVTEGVGTLWFDRPDAFAERTPTFDGR